MTLPTAAEIAELRKLAEAATIPPWRTMTDGDGNTAIVQTAHLTRDVWQIPRSDEDLELIVAMRNRLDSLLAAAERARELEERLRTLEESIPPVSGDCGCGLTEGEGFCPMHAAQEDARRFLASAGGEREEGKADE